MQKALLAIGLLALTGLSGCDVWDRIVEPPKPAAVTCPCAPALRAAEVPAPLAAPRAARSERHYATRRDAAHGYRWQRRYAESSIDIYDYSSASSRYGAHHYGDRRDEHYGVHQQGEEGRQFGEGTRIWADGYGRRHIYDQSAVAHYVDQAQVRAEETPSRLDPWHGYDDNWDD
ncbi:MAG: hypothetical protein KGL26_16035 [Pseudomonadota bacterium]|nr:hypothetical protein [Pseudomonadota bacterium]